MGDAKRLFVIAVLRAAYGDVKNRDLRFHYETSFLSEVIPGVCLSEQALSAFLQDIGMAYSRITEFMRNRVGGVAGKDIVVDGMLKDYNSQDGYLSESSRKARTKGPKDMSVLYAFNPETNEPIAAKLYPGNMLDQTIISNFVSENNITKWVLILDKGFYKAELFEEIDKKVPIGIKLDTTYLYWAFLRLNDIEIAVLKPIEQDVETFYLNDISEDCLRIVRLSISFNIVRPSKVLFVNRFIAIESDRPKVVN